MLPKKLKKRILIVLGIGFILMNVVAFFHAYKFTHFADDTLVKTKKPEELTAFDKIKTLVFGLNNPRPKNKKYPSQTFETIKLKSNKQIEIWRIKNDSARRETVVLFHGYSGEKSGLLTQSDEFQRLGFNTILVDFMGSGGSEGNQTTVGFTEAEEVKTVFDYVTAQGEKTIYLFGTSMGSVAIMKAISDYNLKPNGIIIECPFGSMYQTTCARFRTMNAPAFPMAGLLVFWGGVQNNFWALGHNPIEYATQINCPTLLLYGEQDRNVSRQEIDAIYANLNGKKTLRTYKLAGHESYLKQYRREWQADVKAFLDNN
jgi:uncharacterized protein